MSWVLARTEGGGRGRTITPTLLVLEREMDFSPCRKDSTLACPTIRSDKQVQSLT
jgi:hypothetical protein